MGDTTTMVTAPPRELILEKGRADRRYLQDVWEYRELFAFLAWRDILVRYKQTVMGILWAILRPLIGVAAFSLVFGRIAGLPSGGIPYPLLVYVGMLPWQFFATSLAESATSVVSNGNLISKVYFPRLVVPAASVIVGFIDHALMLLVLLAMMAVYGVQPSWRLVTLPLLSAWVALATLGPGLWLAALTVKYRDFRFVVPFLVQFGLYVSPVGFGSEAVPTNLRGVYAANPMVGIIGCYRWAVLEAPIPSATELALSFAATVIFLAIGYSTFRRMEKEFADLM